MKPVLITLKTIEKRRTLALRSLESLKAHTPLKIYKLFVFTDGGISDEFCSELHNFGEVIRYPKIGVPRLTNEEFKFARKIGEGFSFYYHADDDYVYSYNWLDVLLKAFSRPDTVLASGFAHLGVDRFPDIVIGGLKYKLVSGLRHKKDIGGVIGGSMMFDISWLIRNKFEIANREDWDRILSEKINGDVISVKDTVCQHLDMGKLQKNGPNPGMRFVGE